MKKIENKKGSVLAFSLIIMMMLLVIALSISFVSVNEMKSSTDTRDSSVAFQIADSAAEEFLQIKKTSSSYNMGEAADLMGANHLPNFSGSILNGTYNFAFYNNDGGEILSDAESVNSVKSFKVVGKYKNVSRAIEMDVNFLRAEQMALGYWNSCALMENKNVKCWGNQDYGQLAEYNGQDATYVVSGRYHTCINKQDGSFECWGPPAGHADDYGQSEIPISINHSDITQIDLGGWHSCVLLNDGNVDCWGRNNYSQAEDYNNGDAVNVSAGKFHTCIVTNSGNVNCWGRNRGTYGHGQADPLSSSSNIITPTEVYTGGDAMDVDTGGQHTCIRTNSDIKCWGGNDYCQVIDDGICDSSYSDGDDNIAESNMTADSLSLGGYHTCVSIGEDIECWGRGDESGMSGEDRNQTFGYTGSLYNDLVNFSSGGYHNCAINNLGEVFCWGHNGRGSDIYGQSNPDSNLADPGWGIGFPEDPECHDGNQCHPYPRAWP